MDKKKSKENAPQDQVVALDQYRKNKNEERKREYERILFNRILGVYSFAEKTGLKHIEVADISYTGIKFREEKPENPLQVGSKIALRFYFTPTSYLRLVVETKRVTPFEEKDRQGLEYGCEIDKDTKSYQVIQQLISFMYKYAEVACHDENPPMVWF
jgi:hypothetical protein